MAANDPQTQPQCQMETLEDIFTSNRPKIDFVWSDFFVNLADNCVVEVSGSSGSGKSVLMMEMAAKVIMSNGTSHRPEVLYIDADKSFSIFVFTQICMKYLEGADYDSDRFQQDIDRLHVLTCYDKSFDADIKKLNFYLANNILISLIVVDSLGLFYFSQAQSPDSEFTNKSSYVAYYVKIFDQLRKKFKVSIVYSIMPNLKNYRARIATHLIAMEKTRGRDFIMSTNTKNSVKNLRFAIDASGIKLFESDSEDSGKLSETVSE